MRLKQLCVLARVAVMVSDVLAIAKCTFKPLRMQNTNIMVRFLCPPPKQVDRNVVIFNNNI